MRIFMGAYLNILHLEHLCKFFDLQFMQNFIQDLLPDSFQDIWFKLTQKKFTLMLSIPLLLCLWQRVFTRRLLYIHCSYYTVLSISTVECWENLKVLSNLWKLSQERDSNKSGTVVTVSENSLPSNCKRFVSSWEGLVTVHFFSFNSKINKINRCYGSESGSAWIRFELSLNAIPDPDLEAMQLANTLFYTW